jgi:hypothetical protein
VIRNYLAILRNRLDVNPTHPESRTIRL